MSEVLASKRLRGWWVSIQLTRVGLGTKVKNIYFLLLSAIPFSSMTSCLESIYHVMSVTSQGQ